MIQYFCNQTLITEVDQLIRVSLNDRGETLATHNDGTFKFPNQLLLHNDKLWLADTNNHRLALINTNTDNFAQVQETITVDLGGAYRWPHQFAGSGDGWWVNVGDDAMSHGRIVHLDPGGERDKLLDLPEMTDPLAIAYWRDTLWVTDFSEPILQRYDARGAALDAVESPTLEKVTAQSRRDYDYYRLLGYLGLGGLVLVLIGGFVAAWVLEKSQTIEQLKSIASPDLDDLVTRPAKEVSGSQIHWLTNTMQQKKRIWIFTLVGPLVMLLASLALMWHLQEELSPALIQVLLAAFIFMAVIIAFLYWMFQRIFQQKLGVIGNSIVLEQDASRRTIARAGEIRYTNNHLIADGVIISLGNAYHRFFDRRELELYVYPRLKGADKCGQLALIKHLWRARDPQLIGPMVIILAALILYMWLTFVLPQ